MAKKKFFKNLEDDSLLTTIYILWHFFQGKKYAAVISLKSSITR